MAQVKLLNFPSSLTMPLYQLIDRTAWFVIESCFNKLVDRIPVTPLGLFVKIEQLILQRTQLLASGGLPQRADTPIANRK
jgi:hypothetical protein